MARAKKIKQDNLEQEEIVETVEAVEAEDTAVQEEELEQDEASEQEEQEEIAITQDDVRLVEAILFASAASLTVAQIKERFPEDRASIISDVLEIIREQYEGRGVNLVQRDKRYALRTATDLGDSLRLEKDQPKKFTRAAMETMAVIAYHQPVTRAEIENIRGVATSPGSLNALLQAGWVKMGKRREVPGRPVTWLTTKEFLDHFGLEKLADLPGMEDLKAAGIMDKRAAIEAMPATGDLFEGEEDSSDDIGEVTDEDLIGAAALAEGEGLEDSSSDLEGDETVVEKNAVEVSETADNETEESDEK